MTKIAALLLMVDIMLTSCCHFQGGQHSEDVIVFTVERTGHVEWRVPAVPVGTPMVALGDPYKYHIVSKGDIRRAVETSLQEIGFAVNPERDKKVLPECNHGEPRTDVVLFWTDFFDLNEQVMKALSVSYKDVDIVDSKSIIYQFQVVGCSQVVKDGTKVAFSDPSAVYAARTSKILEREIYSTNLKLTMTIFIRKRGTKGAYVEEKRRGRPKPILDSIKKRIVEATSKVEPVEYPTDKFGNIVF
jgi:hypothetical protein